MSSGLTLMERAILQAIVDEHWPSFRIDQIVVTRREHTGVGRYTHLVDRAGQLLPDGSYGADTRFIEMDNVPNGLFFVLEVAKSRISYLEISSAGADSWDGAERPWRIV